MCGYRWQAVALVAALCVLSGPVSVVAQAASALPTEITYEPANPNLNSEDIPIAFSLSWPDSADPTGTYYCRTLRGDEVIASGEFEPSLDEEMECSETMGLTVGWKTVTLQVSSSPDFTDGTTVSTDARLRVIPGWLTILPPLFTIILAIATQNVLIALFSGIWMAAFFIHWFDPFRGFLRAIDTYVLQAFADEGHIYIILFSWFLSGIVGLMQRAGGAAGIARLVIGFAKTRRMTMLVCFACGLAIFFDDYSNTLIVGATFRAMFDDLLISREKLAYLIDGTSAPIASISPISSWVGFELSLIQDSYEAIGLDQLEAQGYETSPFLVFVKTIPGRYYPIAMLCMQFFLIVMQRDWGPMLRAERRALHEGKVVSDTADKGQTEMDEGLEQKEGVPARWYNAIVPVLLIIVLVIIALVFTGLDAIKSANEGLEEGDEPTEKSIENIFGNSDAYSGLLWSTFAVSIFTIIFYRLQYYVPGASRMQWIWRKDKAALPLMKVDESLGIWIEGIKQLVSTTLVLILAWGIGAAMEALGTNRFIASGVSESVDARAIPVMVFVLAAAISTATGTSWGTMAIMFPIATQAIYASAPGDNDAMLNTIASILSGAVFGDHITPISDTTILSSLASKCDLMHHVKTQAPYAFLVGAISAILGDLLVGYLYPDYVGLLLTIAAVLTASFFLSAPSDSYKPDLFGRMGSCLPAGMKNKFKDKGNKGSNTGELEDDNNLDHYEGSGSNPQVKRHSGAGSSDHETHHNTTTNN